MRAAPRPAAPSTAACSDRDRTPWSASSACTSASKKDAQCFPGSDAHPANMPCDAGGPAPRRAAAASASTARAGGGVCALYAAHTARTRSASHGSPRCRPRNSSRLVNLENFGHSLEPAAIVGRCLCQKKCKKTLTAIVRIQAAAV